ncbi:UDP-glucuronosyltransferase [Arthrospiribacter ruber]|uniref:UDP-glucuronosyltransferase n=1 Tax=Arthrospiribacter ruber TaxID=2487934 RepID=A0A951IYA1_9BACT|nr:UDP-glucuronosyltransferase [Arthrospiribacter ruber]MBW3467658.1 UDP-glucuronosyltransferase [Arthrospiribacter ruber]
MIDYDFRPERYYDGTGPSTVLVRLFYPESQWGEEISIYTNVIDGKIHFEAVDFYGNDIHLSPQVSDKPLSLQELILMIETMDINTEAELGNLALTLSGIPEAESTYYPALERYFSEKRKYYGLR